MKKKFLRCAAAAALICSIILSATACADNSKKNVAIQPELTQIQEICNLATLECYYHNVAKIDKSKYADGTFLDFLKKDRKAWIEYTGIVRIGVDVSKISMNVSGNTVEITMPEPKILSIMIDDDSYTENSYYLSADDWFMTNRITAEMQSRAIAYAQVEMQMQTENDTALMAKAQNRAKKLISNYIEKVGEQAGVSYDITWKYTQKEDEAAE